MGETRVDLLHLLEDVRDAYTGAIEETILISDGLRRDEVTYGPDAVERLSKALKKRGVSRKVLDDAMRDLAV